MTEREQQRANASTVRIDTAMRTYADTKQNSMQKRRAASANTQTGQTDTARYICRDRSNQPDGARNLRGRALGERERLGARRNQQYNSQKRRTKSTKMQTVKSVRLGTQMQTEQNSPTKLATRVDAHRANCLSLSIYDGRNHKKPDEQIKNQR